MPSGFAFRSAEVLTSQQTYYDSKQRSTFNQSGCKDHVTADVAYRFWLTSD